MTKAFTLLIFLLLLVGCGGNKGGRAIPLPPPGSTPTPVFTPFPEPSVSPSVETPSPGTPTPVSTPVPYAVPHVDVTPYLRSQGGKVVDITIQDGDDASAILNAADSFDGSGKLIIRSGSSRRSFKTSVTLKHDSEWHGKFDCDTETANPSDSCVYVHNDTTHDGTNATIYGPTALPERKYPAVAVFMAHQQHLNNYFESRNITIKGFKLIGRQTGDDGGMRQVVSFGNCVDCAAIELDLFDISSIGIQFGGGAAEGKHAKNVLAYKNKLRRFSAAAIALVNVDGAVVAENDIKDPARKSGGEGEQGGISGIDIETNNTDDCAKNIKIFNNVIGYGHSKMHVAGNGILGQNVYSTQCSGGLLIANNLIDGWEGNNEDSTQWGLASGLYFVGIWPDSLITSNVIIRAQHAGLSLYGVKHLKLENNVFRTVGGGGISGWALFGAAGNTFVRNRIVDDKSIRGSSETSSWCDEQSVNNTFIEHQPGESEGCKRK